MSASHPGHLTPRETVIFREGDNGFKITFTQYTRVYPKVSGLAALSENCKWCSSLPLGAVVSLFHESD
jgi:hypothetical protein